MYKDGYLCPIEYEINKDYNQLDIKLNSTGMDFDQEDLQLYNKNKKIIPAIESAITKDNRKHILVFCSSVADANKLSEDLNKVGRTAAVVSAKTPKEKREQILKDFKSGKINIVSNVGTMVAGYDFPELDCVILARPTQSLLFYQQAIGRGIRIAPGKKNVKVIDLCGNVEKFGKIEDFEIVDPGNGLYVLVSGDKQLTGVNLLPKYKR
jgi:DNA repair protein RadD